MDGKAILKMVLKRVDLKGLVVEDLIGGVIKAELEKIVADSSNPYDDMVMALIYPKIMDALNKLADDLLKKVES